MKRFFRMTGLLLALVMVLPAVCEDAKSLHQKGADAEARQDYETAYKYYRQAYDLKPKDLAYRVSAERTRFLASAGHVKDGQKLREQGRLDEALAEFERAAQIDPSSFIAGQEIRRTRVMIEEKKSGTPPPPPSGLTKMIERAGGPVELAPVSQAPITFKATNDTKFIYQTIGNLAGINVLFDPDYVPRRIAVDLNGVTLMEALEVVALESRTFWRAVTSNTIFVAADTTQKRKELEQNVIKTFYVSNLLTSTAAGEMGDIRSALQGVLGNAVKVAALQSQNVVVVRGTPDAVALAEKIINDLDRARPEVIVEVAVMQVNRTKLRDFGIQPPTSVTVALQNNVTTNTNINPNTGLPNTGTTTNTGQNQINLNKLANLSASDFVVTIPPSSINFMLNDSTTKLIQNPQIRALDGQKATLKIGDKIPIATGSFGAGVGGVGLNSLVNTQFTFQDVGVNIEITPRVHAGREVTLKISLDVSAVTGTSNIGGIDQPIIGQRKIEHEIRLKDGEANLLGGILENRDIKTLNGFPWLSQVPILKYFFSSEHTEKAENEIVFVLVPHIVRGQELTALNTRTIDVGTENQIDLRHMSPATQPAAPAQPPTGTPNPPQGAIQPSTGQGTGSAPQGTSQAAQASPAVLTLNPPQIAQPVGSTFSVDVVLSGGQNIYSVPVQMIYDPKSLQLLNVSNGNFLSQDGQAVALVHRDDPASGTLQVTATRPPNSGGASGQGTVFTLTFLAKAAGQSTLGIARAGIKDAAMQAVSVNGTQATVTIK